SSACATSSWGNRAKRPINKKLGELGQAPNRQEVGGIGPSAQSTRSWGNRAKRPIDKKLGESGQAPNRQEVGGIGPSAQSTRTRRPAALVAQQRPDCPHLLPH
ncbi:MAG: hypothetical protein RBU37_14500, partial [Myxococcota bacterium]|nr:hypothetical protein [Myxococcota bacterium]